MKKYLAVLLSISMLFAMVFSVSAEESKKTVNETAIMSVKARVVNDAVKDVLIKNGASINDDSVIEVLKIDNSEDTAVCVVNYDGEEIVQDVFLSYTEDEEGNMVVDNSLAEAIARSTDHNMSGSHPPLSWDGSYIVHATATAAKYIDTATDPYGWMPFYKPYKCSFYYVNYENVTVNSIEVRYITSGAKYSYPGYQYMGSSYDHIVVASKTNPVAGTTYVGYNYFPENFVLSCTGTEDMVLTFINRVNGVTDSYTVKLINKY